MNFWDLAIIFACLIVYVGGCMGITAIILEMTRKRRR